MEKKRIADIPALTSEQKMKMRGRSGYETYWGGWLEGPEIFGNGSTGTYDPFDGNIDDWYRYLDGLFGGNSGGGSGGNGSGYDGTSGGDSGGGNSGQQGWSDVDYGEAFMQIYENYLSNNNIKTIEADKNGDFQIINGVNASLNLLEAPFALGEMLKADMGLAAKIGKGIGIAGLSVGAIDVVIGLTDGDITVGDVVSGISLVAGSVSLFFSIPWLTGVSIVLGIVAVAVNSGSGNSGNQGNGNQGNGSYQ